MVNIRAILIVVIATAFSVPKTRTDKEIAEFYKRLEEYEMKVLKYDGLGYGVQTHKSFSPGDVLFCITSNVSISHANRFPLSDYIKDFRPVDKLAFRILYEKFIGKSKSFINEYVNSLPHEFESASLWTPEQKEYFLQLNLINDFEKYFDRRGDHEKLIAKVKKLMGVNEEMLRFESYIWALETVMSRSLTYQTSDRQEVFILSPYLDVVNHWPNPLNVSVPSIQISNENQCIISGWNYQAGDQIFVDYGKYESAYYFYKYQMNIENPYDFMVYSYINVTKQDIQLNSNSLSFRLLQIILDEDPANSLNKITDVQNYFLDMSDKEKNIRLTAALFRYKAYFLGNIKFEGKLGIREIRRNTPKDNPEKKINDFAVSLRKSIYNHMKVLDSKIIFSLHKLIF